MPSRNTQPLYKRLLESHLRIAGLATLFLVICCLLMIKMQLGLSAIIEERLPTAMASAQAVSAIDNSISRLRANVLSGAAVAPQTDSGFISQATSQIDELANLGALSNEAHKVLNNKLRSLEESQRRVQELSESIGNFPARQMYQQDVLTTYHRIESALSALANKESSNSGDVPLLASNALHQLSKVIRELHECVFTGSAAAVEQFRESSRQLEPSLDALSEKVSLASDERILLDELLMEYEAYAEYADETIQLRQSDEWNRAHYILSNEIEPLAAEVQSQLLAVDSSQYETLVKSAIDSESFAKISGILNISFVFVLAFFAYFLARSNARWAANPLEKLALASDQLAGNPQDSVVMPTEGPAEILHLADRLNLMNQRLARSTQELVLANSELQEYTHIVTHDLKAPLINIRGHTTSLREQFEGLISHADNDMTDSQLRSYIAENMSRQTPEAFGFIETSIAKTTLLMNAILDNSRILFRTLEVENLDLHAVADRVLALFSYKLREIEIHNDLDAQLVTDDLFLEHILINLIDNSIKYLDPARSGVIRLRNEQGPETVDIYVEDNGTGIDSENIDVFKLFQQSNINNEGSGVGLALTATMLTKLGGTIDYRANEPAGTVFILRLPRMRNEDPE